MLRPFLESVDPYMHHILYVRDLPVRSWNRLLRFVLESATHKMSWWIFWLAMFVGEEFWGANNPRMEFPNCVAHEFPHFPTRPLDDHPDLRTRHKGHQKLTSPLLKVERGIRDYQRFACSFRCFRCFVAGQTHIFGKTGSIAKWRCQTFQISANLSWWKSYGLLKAS